MFAASVSARSRGISRLRGIFGSRRVGQAEASSLTRASVDLDSGRFICHRRKTDTGFMVPIFPQLRPLMKSFARARSRISVCLRCTGRERQSPIRASGSDSFASFPMGDWSRNSQAEVFAECLSRAALNMGSTRRRSAAGKGIKTAGN